MATYGGQPIFGRSFTMVTVDNPRSAQINKFFGLNGTEHLDGGLAGRYTEVDGVFTAPDLPTLAFYREMFRSYNDGFARVLVDSAGVAWFYVKMENFTPAKRFRYDPAGWGFVLQYSARFTHLI